MRRKPVGYTPHETHAYEMHARKVLENLQIFHLTNGGAVVDLSRSELQNTSFCASCGVVERSLLRAAGGKTSKNIAENFVW
jgi:hypothetical protein